MERNIVVGCREEDTDAIEDIRVRLQGAREKQVTAAEEIALHFAALHATMCRA